MSHKCWLGLYRSIQREDGSGQAAASLLFAALSARHYRMGLLFTDPENRRVMAPGFKDQRLIALNAQSRLFLWALSAGFPSMRVTRPLVLKPGGSQELY